MFVSQALQIMLVSFAVAIFSSCWEAWPWGPRGG